MVGDKVEGEVGISDCALYTIQGPTIRNCLLRERETPKHRVELRIRVTMALSGWRKRNIAS
jgi:hypothetical protein